MDPMLDPPLADSAPEPLGNSPAYSVSELAGALKRTLEDAYGFVRLKGEISKITRHASGHVYLTLKDDKAAIDGVIWKGVVSRLKAKPEQGAEVIVTGKITTFPASSKYQLVIETLELAGIGALLAQLERLKARLHGEGLFDLARKKPLPPSPKVIGVITSPTGAVIRDILHRIRDRWPCHVVVWPVVVQGEASPPQVISAIEGFNALSPKGAMPRPDVLIVARGGGSIEDLWPFNNEALARAVAASDIPVISAVGHETDTTLIDYVSDRRAPTPTGAAEIATPVLADLKGLVLDLERRRLRSGQRLIDNAKTRLLATSRGLPRPMDLLGGLSQRFDLAAQRLGQALARNTAVHERRYASLAGRLSPVSLDRPRLEKARQLAALSSRLEGLGQRFPEQKAKEANLQGLMARLDRAILRRLDHCSQRLLSLESQRRSLDPDRPLKLGFARVNREDGALVRSATQVDGQNILTLTFHDGALKVLAHPGAEAQAVKTETQTPSIKPPKKKGSSSTSEGGQGSLF